ANGTITRSTVTGASAYGILLYSSDGNTVTGNVLTANGIGINVTASAANLIYDNYMNNTGQNAYDDAAAPGLNAWNVTKQPAPYPNILGAAYLGGNYWAAPGGTGFSETCTDLDGDGLCDAPYAIPGGSSVDYLPLTYGGPIWPVPFAPFGTLIPMAGSLAAYAYLRRKRS
ncbi:MAG: hypothetical protein GXO65_01775, partial [Euryarchaeota archaeon]|nr:hypothetical protein [Euryarchaeota archaeon]